MVEQRSNGFDEHGQAPAAGHACRHRHDQATLWLDIARPILAVADIAMSVMNWADDACN
jgi:hypothetical protein